ncbi:MAG: poly-beta-1,6-N-acetyl-D-glucosamine N-deacetylase PgaB, partial [Pseudomonadota bacterium]|nr:poly-beta-1,6-N-acetyl-D-glucosamine N-deacetylase PgaB [Pseudomonadota bacterium]
MTHLPIAVARRVCRFLLALAALCVLLSTACWADSAELRPDPPQSFRVLCYHDIRDRLRDTLAQSPESTALDTRELIRHFSWLQKNGFHPVSLQQIVDARAGRATLPSKAVLLSFDDGYASTYTNVFPLLRQFNFPALVALVGSWTEQPASTPAGTSIGGFLSWAQVREMQRSGLVEVASHSFALHQGLLANPQGNLMPAATSRRYDRDTGSYESDAQYATRIGTDLRRNAELIEHAAGYKPRAMVWPYGAYNALATQWAVEQGMPIGFTLDSGPNPPSQPLERLRRELISFNTTVTDLQDQLRAPPAGIEWQSGAERVMQVALDDIADHDPAVQEANLSALLERVVQLHPSTVYLNPFAQADAHGAVSAAYFPNRFLALQTDLFSRAAWQLRTRAHVRVYADLSDLALPIAQVAATHIATGDAADPRFPSERNTDTVPGAGGLGQAQLMALIEDLSKHATFAGMVFPATPTSASASSQLTVAQAGRFDANAEISRAVAQEAAFSDFTQTLAHIAQRYQPTLLTARKLMFEQTGDTGSALAAALKSDLLHYDHVVLVVPAMAQRDLAAHAAGLVQRALAVDARALGKTIFLLQLPDQRARSAWPTALLAAQMRELRINGVRHLGYG